jgi:hypothetical protein
VTPAEVAGAARAAGRHLLAEPKQVPLDLPTAHGIVAPKAIYLAFARDGALHYIGKVDRAAGHAGQRLEEHLRTSPRKRRTWRTVWVVPLAAGMTAGELQATERALIRCYRPPGNIQHAAA